MTRGCSRLRRRHSWRSISKIFAFNVAGLTPANLVRYGFLGTSDVSVWLSLGVTAALALPGLALLPLIRERLHAPSHLR